MAELAGLVLGGLPLVLYALDNYKRCLEPCKDYTKYDETLSEIRDNVFIQERLLRTTVENLGLHDPKYVELEEHLRRLYREADVERFMSIIRRMDKITKKLAHNLDVDAQGKPNWNSESDSRVGWEWRRVRRSFRRKEREQLIDDLQYWNTALSKCFERPEVPSEDTSSMVQALQAQFNPKICDMVRQQARMVKTALDSGWQCCCSGQHHASLDLNWHSNHATSSPEFTISFSYSELCHGKIVPDEGIWQKTTMMIQENPENEVKSCKTDLLGVPMAKDTAHKRRTRWIPGLQPKQSRMPSVSPSRIPAGGCNVLNQSPSSIPTEIRSLCQLMQDLKGNSDSLGYLSVPDSERKVNITSLAKSGTTPTRVLPLRSFLPPNQQPTSLGFSRRRRFETAAAAAWAVLLLCGTPWLTEFWDKDDIVVFLEKVPQKELLAKNPSISHIYNQSIASDTLPDSPSAEKFRGKFIRNKAIFTLGIVLIELCLNRTFDELRKQEGARNSLSTVLDDYEIANELIDQVYLESGDPYGDACRRCIGCEFPGRDVTKDFEFAQFRQHFYNGVVAPVQATSDAMLGPSSS